MFSKIESLILQYNGKDKIIGHLNEELYSLPLEAIECITSINGKIYAIDTNNQQYLINYRLYEIEKMLPNYFVRINKSSIANQNYFKKFKLSFNGSVDIIFKSGYQDYISRRCFKELRRRILGL